MCVSSENGLIGTTTGGYTVDPAKWLPFALLVTVVTYIYHIYHFQLLVFAVLKSLLSCCDQCQSHKYRCCLSITLFKHLDTISRYGGEEMHRRLQFQSRDL